MREQRRLLIFGLGYCGSAIGREAMRRGFLVVGTKRDTANVDLAGIRVIDFASAECAIGWASHLISTVPPDDTGDPVIERFGKHVVGARRLHWIGYLSSTSVYGDRFGGAVDEETPVLPRTLRAKRRVSAEAAWTRIGAGRALDIFRLAGIYGPDRSAFDALRAGKAYRVVKPGHKFNRIHRDDIVLAVMEAMSQSYEARRRVLNICDDTPAEPSVVLAEAAALLGVKAPPAVPFSEAGPQMSDVSNSFWAECRTVSSQKTRETLKIAWRYPSFREGLRAILSEERDKCGFQ